MIRRALPRVLASLAILLPCFWHARIQAGDLGSHIYNAWLAQLIAAGRAPGLVTVPQTTNVLFDWLLKLLLDAFGAGIAQRVAVSLAVLVFVWGAFAFVCRTAGRVAWHLLPVIAVLAYGWVFRMGLFNFYISLGLCFWALAVRRPLVVVPLLALAYVAHGMPVAWAVALFGYEWLAGRIDARHRMFLFAAAMVAIVLARAVLQSVWKTLWFTQQFSAMVAIDQIWIYGGKYMLLAGALLFCWGLPLAGWMRDKGARQVLSGVPFQICALTAAGILILPDWIRIPGYHHALVFLAERMALALGVCICALVGAAVVGRGIPIAMAAIALVFFAFSYTDEAKLNALEDQMDALVAQLPPGQRVVSAVMDLNVPTNPTTHMIDRACLGRCFSFGNYEPQSAQFRIRIAGETPLVVAKDADEIALETGAYVVKERELPLYQVAARPDGTLEIHPLAAGQKTGITPWNGL